MVIWCFHFTPLIFLKLFSLWIAECVERKLKLKLLKELSSGSVCYVVQIG